MADIDSDFEKHLIDIANLKRLYPEVFYQLGSYIKTLWERYSIEYKDCNWHTVDPKKRDLEFIQYFEVITMSNESNIKLGKQFLENKNAYTIPTHSKEYHWLFELVFDLYSAQHPQNALHQHTEYSDIDKILYALEHYHLDIFNTLIQDICQILDKLNIRHNKVPTFDTLICAFRTLAGLEPSRMHQNL